MVNTDKRLQLLKNEGHVLCHTKVAPGETGVVIPTITHTYTQTGERSMTSLTITAGTTGLLARVAQFFVDLNEKRIERAAINRTIKELHKLSDRELNDIGIGRGDIYAVATHDLTLERVRRNEAGANANLKGWV